jgi:hypothetical protein
MSTFFSKRNWNVTKYYHQGTKLPYPTQERSGAAQMGQNMTRNGSKNSLKQRPQKTSALGPFHQRENPAHHNMCFHIVFGWFLQSKNLAGFIFLIYNPLFDKILT